MISYIRCGLWPAIFPFISILCGWHVQIYAKNGLIVRVQWILLVCTSSCALATPMTSPLFAVRSTHYLCTSQIPFIFNYWGDSWMNVADCVHYRTTLLVATAVLPNRRVLFDVLAVVHVHVHTPLEWASRFAEISISGTRRPTDSSQRTKSSEWRWHDAMAISSWCYAMLASIRACNNSS